MLNIAVVTPFFNTQEYLHRCIKSILGQKNISLQLFLIDDGSTDNSATIARFYQQTDPRVIFISKINEGQAVARNIGIKLAEAEYIYFVDSDDWLGDNTLSVLYETAKRYDLDICSPGVPKHYFDKPLEYVSCLPCKSQFIKLSIIQNFNLLQPSISSGQDGVFSHIVLSHCDRIGMTDSASFHYTHGREGSTFAAHLERHDLVPLLLKQHFAAIEQHYDRFDLWKSNSLRLLMFISDESLRNRVEPHLPYLDAEQKKSCFELLSRIAKKAFRHISDDKKLHLLPPQLALITQDVNWLVKNYEEKYAGKKFNLSVNSSTNIQHEKLIIAKYSDTKFAPTEISEIRPSSIETIERQPIPNSMSSIDSDYDFSALQTEFKMLRGKIDLAINTINNSTVQVATAIRSPASTLKDGNKEIAVSMTTLPSRLPLVHLAIESIFNQTILPGHIILWIADTINIDKVMTPQIEALRGRGLEIRQVADVGPHTKLIYALNAFPNLNIITLDDDIVYPINTISCLWDQHIKFPKAIVCNWARELSFDAIGNVKGVRSGKLLTPPRLECEIEQASRFSVEPSLLAFPYGTSGVLYPPHSLSKEVFNVELFRKLCPKEDDIWFKAMSLLNRTPVVVTNLGINPSHHCVTGSQSEALRHENHGLNQNRIQMDAVFSHFDLYKRLDIENR
jgi:glycosyltransferase involved in cell wall biosynthesis